MDILFAKGLGLVKKKKNPPQLDVFLKSNRQKNVESL